MVKEVYLGHNKIMHQLYINDSGENTIDSNIVYAGPDDDLQAVVKHLAGNYKDRKAVLKTDLPAKMVSELQKLIERNKALKKMKVE